MYSSKLQNQGELQLYHGQPLPGIDLIELRMSLKCEVNSCSSFLFMGLGERTSLTAELTLPYFFYSKFSSSSPFCLIKMLLGLICIVSLLDGCELLSFSWMSRYYDCQRITIRSQLQSTNWEIDGSAQYSLFTILYAHQYVKVNCPVLNFCCIFHVIWYI